jgi:Tfp pilus assembly protein PilV
MKNAARKAFTLIEVNMAILILSAGVLALITLFALGFRENRQSREDVGSAAFADAVIGRIAMAASATNLKWSAFRKLGNYPSDRGWSVYYGSNGHALQSCHETARDAFGGIMGELSAAADGELSVDTSWPTTAEAGLKAGLVVIHEPDSARLKISFRAGRHAHELLSQPMYYTEVRFQGDPLK